jgi:hypothetical protein
MDKKDVRNLEIVFDKTSEEARRTYDILKGRGGREGAERIYLLAKKAAEKNPNNKTFAERLNKAKSNYDTANANYKKAQDAKNAARTKLNTALGTSEKQKDAKSLVDKYNEAVEKVKTAETLIASRGQAAYDAAVQTAYQAGVDAKAAGGKIKPLPAAASGVVRPPAPSAMSSTDSSRLSDADQVKAMLDSAQITLNGSQYQVLVTSPNETNPDWEIVKLSNGQDAAPPAEYVPPEAKTLDFNQPGSAPSPSKGNEEGPLKTSLNRPSFRSLSSKPGSIPTDKSPSASAPSASAPRPGSAKTGSPGDSATSPGPGSSLLGGGMFSETSLGSATSY